ncbi:MAG: radical SAM protein [Candidatus Saganbacteria bacterium]|nr:radical SAM protein [Candidatus Saganbacteria bacterium]
MTPEEKLEILGASAKYDISCCGGSQRQVPRVPGVYYASGSKGNVIPILKTLFTNRCKNDCVYCTNRINHDFPRVKFNPEELASVFMQIYQKEFVEGLFLSSGVEKSADQTMQEMIRTAELLRFKHHFRGFLHLKILPGSSDSVIQRAVRLATRVSVNIEAPTADRLKRLSSTKDFMQGIIHTMDVVNQEGQRRGEHFSQTTQFIVGAAGEDDQDIVKTMFWLRKTKGMERTYFSAFRPVEGCHKQQNFMELEKREHRLYQVEFLQRLYGFTLSDIYFGSDGRLPTGVDPKLNYALHNMHRFPVEVNTASYFDLLRIPGIGKTIADRIYQLRTKGRFTGIDELRKLGVNPKKSAPFILVNGKKQGDIKDLFLVEQLSLAI